MQPGHTVPARIEIWPRGGGKSSTVELAVAFVCARLSRRFVLYACGTQEQADAHVQSIGDHLEAIGIDRALNKYGSSKGWRREQLRAANGFNVAGIGLDSAVRGIKLGKYRPDLIVLDDVDSLEDSPDTIRKKIDAITSNILPAGSSDVAVVFVQNLIHEDSIMSKLWKGEAEFLLDREIHPPEQAVVGLQLESEIDGNNRKVYRIIDGAATWEGQSLGVCEEQINKYGPVAFMRESQHEVDSLGGIFFDVSAIRYVDRLPDGIVFRWCRAWDLAATQGGGDFTAGVLLAMDPSGVCYVVDVKRYQYSTNDVRALIDRTWKADRAGIVYGDDKRTRQGKFVAAGKELFRFVAKKLRLRLTQDPSQAGKDQATQLKARFPSAVLKPAGGKKSHRARGIQECCNAGNLVLVKGEWNADFVRELKDFTETETEYDFDDQVDAAADSYNELYIRPSKGGSSAPKSEGHDHKGSDFL